jgi:two-component system, LytTR family, response regulator
MNKVKVIIIDDESKSIQTLAILLEHYYEDIEVLATAQSMKSGLKVIEQYKDQIDILFVDIQMPEGDGFHLLQQVPAINFQVIFTTAYDHYAIKAIKFSALDYLLKPIDNTELGNALNKYRAIKNKEEMPASIINFKQALQQKKMFEKLAVSTLNEIIFIKLEDILYMKSSNNYTTLFFETRQQMISSRNIGYYEELLEEHHFYRVHNSYLVNLKKVERFIKSKNGLIEIEGGKTIEVSARRKETLLEKLNLH